MLTTKEVIETERECVQRNGTEFCDRDCLHCDLVLPEEEILKAYDDVLLMLRKHEEGRLLELPFGVGDIVYYLDNSGFANRPIPREIHVTSQAQAINMSFLSNIQYFHTLEEAQREIDTIYKKEDV